MDVKYQIKARIVFDDSLRLKVLDRINAIVKIESINNSIDNINIALSKLKWPPLEELKLEYFEESARLNRERIDLIRERSKYFKYIK